MKATINAELLRSALKAVGTTADECFIEITQHGGKVVCDCCKERIYNTSNEYLNTIPVKTKT